MVISAVRELAAFPGFQIGQQDEAFANVRKDLETLPNTDASGAASVQIPLPEIAQTSLPLKAGVTLRVRETSGRALADRIELQVNSGKPYIGVKPLFQGTVAEGSAAAFEVIGIAPDGKQTVLSDLKWEVSLIDNRFQWYQRNGHWSYEQIAYEKRVAGGVISTGATGSVKIEAPAGDGQYRLDIASTSAQGPATSLTFNAGYYLAGNSDTPEILDLALDRQAYNPGDAVNVRILPRMAGRALVAIVNDKVLTTQLIDVGDQGGAGLVQNRPVLGAGRLCDGDRIPAHRQRRETDAKQGAWD